MHVLHIRGGSKASWARLHREQDLDSVRKNPEAEEFDRELLDL